MNDNDETQIDQNQIQELKSLMEGGFKDFIISYFQDFDRQNKDLSLAIEQKNLENARKIAHALKGNSSSVGASGLAKICQCLESSSKNGDYEDTVHQYHLLQIILPQIKEAYQKLTS